MLSVLGARLDAPLGGGVALPRVGDEHTRCLALLLGELAKQAFGGLRVSPALDQDIENEAILVDGTPEPMLLPGDADGQRKSGLAASSSRAFTPPTQLRRALSRPT